MNRKIINFEIHGDERGSLIALEGNKNIPFEIKRVYYIFDTKKDVARGFHSHKNLQQVLVAVSGSCKIRINDGKDKEVFELNSPDKALYLGNNIWREMFDFSSDCVLLVLASEHYNPDEYTRDYNEFLKEVN